MQKQDYLQEKNAIIQYFSDFNSDSELQDLDLELPEKSGSKFVKFYKWNNLTTLTVSYGCGMSKTLLHHLQAMFTLVNDGYHVP